MGLAASHSAGLASELNHLSNKLRDAGDLKNAEILEKLLIKLNQKEVCAACFGYVSAGKSKLLNVLIGEELLPVSPLPTSKNFVYIHPEKGNDLKRLEMLDIAQKEPVKALCVDESIQSLEIINDTPDGICFLDTPGIDSLDQGAMANNLALFVADCVIFVADYNQVQSQINFSFLKSLQLRDIPYLLVVNQIDKHVGLELSLSEFHSKLLQALNYWELKPIGIYLTSLMVPSHPGSQLGPLKEMLSQLSKADATTVISTVLRSVPQVLQQHGEFITEQQEAERDAHLWVREQSTNEQDSLAAFEKLERKMTVLKTLSERIEINTLKEVDKLLDNAPLFSYETRELVRLFLESRQPGFKAGIFARAAKTEAEREERLQTLYKELVTRSEANLTWHLRKILSELPLSYDLQDEGFRQEASEMTVAFPIEILLQTVHPGAMVSGEYVMHYSRELGAAIKGLYRKHSLDWIRRAQETASRKIGQEMPDLLGQYEYYQKLLGSFAKLRNLEILRQSHIEELHRAWDSLVVQWVSSQDATEQNSLIDGVEAKPEPEPKQESQVADATPPMIVPSSHNLRSHMVHPKLWNTAEVLRHYADQTEILPGFGLIVQSLRQRAERLENSLFTVALFGAFSAGKSSFANALLGDIVLPVSPNPTTAAINKILPPTKVYPHGTIKVKFKSVSELTTDVLASLQKLGFIAADLDEALNIMKDLHIQDAEPEAQPHLGFLRAVWKGQALFLAQLGEELKAEFSAFRDYIVQEEKACFVESIELYFSCPLTESGIALVDTPGSNSINARHTNVAFDYIKNADAVLFLTYYNNPFCKADAQFLGQLGKVKDAFEMDKMFFLVNAADLAQTPEELNQVLQHVKENLHAFDIIHPRVFPVSSQLALLAKLAASERLDSEREKLYRQRLKISERQPLPDAARAMQASGLTQFEERFYAFIEDDLIALAVEAARKETVRVLNQVEALASAAQMDGARRAERDAHYRTLEQTIHAALEKESFETEAHSFNQEIDELFYYVRQRVLYRFSDWFNESFFILAKPKEEQPKSAVEKCLRGFLLEVETDLLQEVRATSLRAARFTCKTLNQIFQKLKDQIEQVDAGCLLNDVFECQFSAEPTFQTLTWKMEATAKISSLYKNPKDWVEGEGRKKMREALRTIVEPQMQAWLDRNKTTLKAFWLDVFSQETRTLREQVRLEVSVHYQGLTEALGQGDAGSLALAETCQYILAKLRVNAQV